MLGKRTREETNESSFMSYILDGTKKVIASINPLNFKKKIIETTIPSTIEDEDVSINYLWVGPPCINNKRFKFHDIAGPIAMSEQLSVQMEAGGQTYPITFWCLSKHAEHYRNIFEKYKTNIHVETIEDYLRLEQMNDESSMKDSAKQLLEYIEKVKDNNCTNSNVIAKDGFSLFLLASQSGYIMDTNVFPAQKGNENQYCTVNLIKQKKVATAVVFGGSSPHDFYLMYSPQKHLPLSIKIFEAWIENIHFGNIAVFNPFKQEMELIRNTNYSLGVQKYSYKSYGGIYDTGRDINIFSHLNPFDWGQFSAHLKFNDVNQRIGDSARSSSASIGGITFVTSFIGDDCVSDDWYHDNIPSESAFVLKMNLCPFRKYHSKAATGSELYYYEKSKNKFTLLLEGLQFFDQDDYYFSGNFNESEKLPSINLIPFELIESKFSAFLDSFLNLQPEKLSLIPHLTGSQDETLLHAAINLNILSAVELLLKKDPDLNLKATYTFMPDGTIFTFTPYELALFLKREKIRTLLENKIDVRINENLIDEIATKPGRTLLPQYDINTEIVVTPSLKNSNNLLKNISNRNFTVP